MLIFPSSPRLKKNTLSKTLDVATMLTFFELVYLVTIEVDTERADLKCISAIAIASTIKALMTNSFTRFTQDAEKLILRRFVFILTLSFESPAFDYP